MINCSADFKTAFMSFGRQLKASVTIGSTTYDEDDIVGVTPAFEGELLTAVMRSLTVELFGVDSVEKGASVSATISVKVGGSWESLILSGYTVYEQEYDEGADSLTVTCYDGMLQAMKDFDVTLTYPTTVAGLLGAICTACGYTLGTATFPNSARTVASDIYDGLGYTFRDVLTEIAQASGRTAVVTGSTLYLLAPTASGYTITPADLQQITFGDHYGPVNSVVISRQPQEDNVYLQDASSVAEDGLTEIKIADNLLMDSDRSAFLTDLLAAVDDMEFDTGELKTYGIPWLDVCDLFTCTDLDGVSHTMIALQNSYTVGKGCSGSMQTVTPEMSKTDYKKAASATDKSARITELIVDKQAGEISALASRQTETEGTVSDLSAQVTLNSQGLTTVVSKVDHLAVGNRNYIRNSEPEVSPPNYNDDPVNSWQHYRSNSNIVYTPQAGQVAFTFTAADEYAQIQRYYRRNGSLCNSVDLTAFIDGDSVSFSFEVKSSADFTVAFNLRAASTSSSGFDYSLWETKPETEVEGDGEWHRIYALAQIPEGFAAMIGAGPYSAAVVFYITASAAQTVEIRKLMMDKSNVPNDWVMAQEDKTSTQKIISTINQSAESIQINANKISLAGKTIDLTADTIAITSTKFSLTADGTLNCSSANITGGSININTASQTTDAIQLNYGNCNLYLSPQYVKLRNTQNGLTIGMDTAQATMYSRLLTLGGADAGNSAGVLFLKGGNDKTAITLSSSLNALMFHIADGSQAWKAIYADDGIYFYNSTGTSLTAKYDAAVIATAGTQVSVGTTWTLVRSISVTDAGWYSIFAQLVYNGSAPRGVAIVQHNGNYDQNIVINENTTSISGRTISSLYASTCCKLAAGSTLNMYAKSASAANNTCYMEIHRIA